MPPEVKITYNKILDSAISIVREKGIENLNARSVAEELGSSVHPIFRNFESMEGLKQAVHQKATDIYNQRMFAALNSDDNGFEKMGLTYINFAKEEPNLFKLIFMSNAFGEQSIMEIVGSTEGDEEVLQMLCQTTGLSRQAAKELYAGSWIMVHGMAVMYATNNCRYNAEEVSRIMDITFSGIIMQLKSEAKQPNEEGRNADK